MSRFKVNVTSVGFVTHDVVQIRTEKPAGLTFTPGQATEIFLDKSGWEEEGRPFTFTSLPTDDYLEFTIKTYPSRKGVTNELRTLSAGDALILNDIFGAIEYRGEGVFIAGGAGVTPFISIFRSLEAEERIDNNKLIFANKTKDDIILKAEFERLLGKNFVNILSEENVPGQAHGLITEEFLKKHVPDFSKMFYLCGPPPMMEAVEAQLANLGVDPTRIIKEEG
ncbi:MAG: flavodoxin reductase [Cyclobacteriaceae bacterium]|jgi:ferredoxin-NADP reductase|nr:flavodoxin reductase [Cyclobacteriaceae bacterium]